MGPTSFQGMYRLPFRQSHLTERVFHGTGKKGKKLRRERGTVFAGAVVQKTSRSATILTRRSGSMAQRPLLAGPTSDEQKSLRVQPLSCATQKISAPSPASVILEGRSGV